MPVFRRGPRIPQKFFQPLAPFSGSVYCEPLTANLRLNVGATAQGFGGATYGGATYAGNLGQFFAPLVTATANISVTPTTAALVLTRFAPTVSTPRLVTPTTKALVLATFAPTVSLPRVATPTTRALVLTTFTPAVSTPRLVTPGVRALILTTFAPTVTTSAGGPITVTPITAALVLTTFAPSIPGADTGPQGGSGGGAIVRHGLVRVPRRSVGRPARPARPRAARRPLVLPTIPIDDEDAILALYGAGAINDEEFAALIS